MTLLMNEDMSDDQGIGNQDPIVHLVALEASLLAA